MDEFLNGRNMAFQQGSYRPRGHGDYTEYVEMFGWGAIQDFNRQINADLNGRDWDQWEHNRNITIAMIASCDSPERRGWM